MVVSELPDVPDFKAIEASARRSADQRMRIQLLIGNLVTNWSNNESMFIYLLMVLLKTDFTAAAITFMTLNTTRARLDLIRRLAKLSVRDAALLRKIERLSERFSDCTKLRNEFNHCIYRFNEQAEITHADILRVVEKKREMSIVTTKEFNDERIREITRVIAKLQKINREIWELIPVLESHLSDAAE